jgi:hypothetical protein
MFPCPRKSAIMWVVNLPWYKRALWLLVIYCILYVLISPLPEDDATLPGSAMALFVLVTYALLGLFILDLSSALRPSRLLSASLTEVLDKTCVRLC